MMMQETDHWDELLRKALEEEPMSERELRDFGEAMRSPEYAEEYLFMQRIIRDAESLVQESPSPGFADGVMSALPQMQTRSMARRSLPMRPIAIGTSLIIFAGILLLLPIDILYSNYAAPFAQQAWQGMAGWMDSISIGMTNLYQNIGNLKIPGSLPAALVVALLGMAVLLNYLFGARQNEWK